VRSRDEPGVNGAVMPARVDGRGDCHPALARHEEIITDSGEPMNPMLHLIVANQLLAADSAARRARL
jgi:hypothetical protein